MFQKLKITMLSLVALFTLAGPMLAAPAAVLAQNNPDIQNSLCYGGSNLQISNNPDSSCSQIQGNNTSGVNKILTEVINVFSVVVGVVAVIMIIVGGFRYITSGGQAEKITSAKNTILYAIVGLIIVALAQVIVKFVLSKATST